MSVLDVATIMKFTRKQFFFVLQSGIFNSGGRNYDPCLGRSPKSSNYFFPHHEGLRAFYWSLIVIYIQTPNSYQILDDTFVSKTLTLK